MRTLPLALLVCLALPAAARPVHDGDDLRAENRRLRTAVDDLADGLDRIDRAADHLRDRRGAQRIHRLVADTLDRVQDEGDDSTVDIDDLVARVQNATYSDQQLALVQEASVGSFHVADVVRLMKACSYDDTRIEVAVALYPRIVDPGNWYQVVDGFDYASSIDTLRSRLGQ